jgi:hypothetical protein
MPPPKSSTALMKIAEVDALLFVINDASLVGALL